MKIKEVMIPDLTSVSDDTTIKEVVKIMSRQRIVGLPVVDKEQNVIGMITESDIAKACLPGYYKELQNPSFLPDFDQFSQQYVRILCHVFIFSYFLFLFLTISGIQEQPQIGKQQNYLLFQQILLLYKHYCHKDKKTKSLHCNYLHLPQYL